MAKLQWLFLLCLLFASSAVKALDHVGSLRSALVALQRREQEETNEEYGDQEHLYGPNNEGDDENIYNTRSDAVNVVSPDFELAEIDVVRFPRIQHMKKNNVKGHIDKLSAFRERNSDFDGAGGQKFSNEDNNDSEYIELLEKLFAKYKDKEPSPEQIARLIHEEKLKRSKNSELYPNMWGPVAYKKKRSSGTIASRALSTNENGLDNKNNEDEENNKTDDMEEEYTIAFAPLEDDPFSQVLENGGFIDSHKKIDIKKRSSGPMPANLAKLSERATTDKPKDLSSIGDLMIPHKDDEENSHEYKTVKITSGSQNHSKPNSSNWNLDQSHEQIHNHGHHSPTQAGEFFENSPENQPLKIEKKSIDWSQYFGIDKRARDVPIEKQLQNRYLQLLKQEINQPSDQLQEVAGGMIINKSYRGNNFNANTKRLANNNANKYGDVDGRLRAMGRDIVDDAFHLSNVEEFNVDSPEEQQLKEKLLSRLAAAYSLERMRTALREFEDGLKSNKNILKSSETTDQYEDKKEKRVSVKKEKVELPRDHKNNEPNHDDFESEQGAGHYIDGKTEEPFSEGYMGSGREQRSVAIHPKPIGECKDIEKINKRCGALTILGDDYKEFIPICSLHQICYLCNGASTNCDLPVLSEVDTICEANTVCQKAGRGILMVLREIHTLVLDRTNYECPAHSCLERALHIHANWRDIIYG